MKSLLFSLLGEWQPKTRFNWTRTLIELASNLMCVFVSLDCRWAAELANFRSSMCGEWVGKMRIHLMPTFGLRFDFRPKIFHTWHTSTTLTPNCLWREIFTPSTLLFRQLNAIIWLNFVDCWAEMRLLFYVVWLSWSCFYGKHAVQWEYKSLDFNFWSS